MDVPCDDQVILKNRRPVHQDVVLPAFPALEPEGMLMVKVVLFAQRTPVVDDRKPARIGLQGHQKAPQGHLTGLCALECPVFGGHCRPYRQLVMHEFIDIDCHNWVKLGNFRRISYSSASRCSRILENSYSKLGVRIRFPNAASSSP